MQKSDQYLKVALAAAKKAGIVFKANFGKPKRVSLKGDDPRNFVTEIDKRLEKFIKAEIHKNFPSHNILGEESGLSDFKSHNGFRWYIDPVDGTTNYIHGMPMCCISIGLWDSEGPLVSVVYSPALNYLFTASRGKGAYLNGIKVKISNKTELINSYGGFGWGRDVNKATANFPKLIKILNKIRTLGSSAIELCFVGCGIYDFHVQAKINIWDFAAAVLIVTEAGGKVADWQGNKPTPESHSLIAANSKIFPELLKHTKKLS
jgi:myo-inositol-1(or 4)-monophosphatase